jgi:hypothetical protein
LHIRDTNLTNAIQLGHKYIALEKKKLTTDKEDKDPLKPRRRPKAKVKGSK